MSTLATLEDPGFKWVGGDWKGNSPRAVVGLLPSISRDEPFRKVQHLIHTGDLVGKQTDWGCWVAIASRAKLLQLIDEWYSDKLVYLTYEKDTESAPDVRMLISQLESKDVTVR